MKNRIESVEQYAKDYREALGASEAYWERIAQDYQWRKKWNTVQTGDFNDLNIRWFDGAKLNITENCLDRHVENHPDKVALYWEPNDPKDPPLSFTYREVLEQVNKFANVLSDKGVKKGDRVCFYMSMVPELLFGALACARIGAVHCVVFAGFSAHALASRINDSGAKLLVVNDQSCRGNKVIELKQIADEALKEATVETVLVFERTGAEVAMQEGRDEWLNPLLAEASSVFEAVEMDAEDPLFIIYTSGSTGAPKGLVHTTAGFMVWSAETYKNVFQVGADDIFWCTADIGWITGHSYIVYAPLLNGSSQVMFEGVPTWPSASRFWEVCDKYMVTHFYTAPTAIRALQAQGEGHIEKADLSSLKVLGSVGEPINEEAWEWYHEKIGKGRCPIVDTWWQTENGGVMISTLAGVTPSIPGHATIPLPGVEPVIVDNDGKRMEGVADGSLCIARPWPGIARTIYGDHERYKQTYFTTYPGLYFSGDGAKRDEKGDYRITGRVDDVINVSGHRIGTAEIEEAINEHDEVAESAVVGFPHDIKGHGIMAYVMPVGSGDHDEQKVLQELNKTIVQEIGPIAKLDKILVVNELPKTRSGKIMRRILRKIAANETDSLGDISTLDNSEVVQAIIEKAGKIK